MKDDDSKGSVSRVLATTADVLSQGAFGTVRQLLQDVGLAGVSSEKLRDDGMRADLEFLLEQLAIIFAQVTWLRDAFVVEHATTGKIVARLDGLPTLEEVKAMILQIVESTKVEGLSAKRRAMALVLVNGLQDSLKAKEMRFLLGAIQELSLDHIEILRTALDPDNNWYVIAPPGEIGLALLNELKTRHLVGERTGTDEDASILFESHPDEWYEKRLPPFARKANLKPFEKPDARRMVRLTELGERLLNLLRDPSTLANG